MEPVTLLYEFEAKTYVELYYKVGNQHWLVETYVGADHISLCQMKLSEEHFRLELGGSRANFRLVKDYANS